MNERNLTTLSTRTVTGLSWALFLLFSWLYMPEWWMAGIIIGSGVHVLLQEWPQLFKKRDLFFGAVTILYLLLPFFLMLRLNRDLQYRWLLAFAVVATAIFDTASYAAGLLFGRHKIAPHISPGKTWEGFAGGLIAVGLLLISMQWYFNGYSALRAPLLSFAPLIATAALAGDLFESWLKRRVGIKDTGTFLPGHGGILDRIDGLLVVIVVVYCLKDWLF